MKFILKCNILFKVSDKESEWGIMMIEFKYDTQLLIEGENLKKEEISKHINKNLKGDCLIVVQVGNLVKIHFHTNEPWFLLQYCATVGDIFDIVVEDMDRQIRGLKG